MPRLTPNTAPPPDYYANNLRAVVAHVQKHSEDLLGPSRRFVQALLSLGNDAQRLLARLIMRTTPVVRIDSLNYAEVANRDLALEELAASGLIDLNSEVSAMHLLERLKVPELKALFPEMVVKKDRKLDLMQRITSAYTDARVRKRCKASVEWLCVDQHQSLRRVQLAYFGDLYRDLTEFVLRDLGVSEFENYELGESARAFDSADELGQYLELSTLAAIPVTRRALALPWLFEHPLISASVIDNRSLLRRRDKLLNAWGRDFERSKQPELAHACYSRSTSHPARERRIRLYTQEIKREAKEQPDEPNTPAVGLRNALLDDIRKQPWAPEEALFAARVRPDKLKPARNPAKTRAAVTPWTETIWATPHQQMPGVEMRTAVSLCLNGGKAWHTENALLQSLLGLAFWDIIFAPVPGMFTHPFQTGPRDLYWPDFRARRAELIDARLSQCADLDRLWARIEDTLACKAGRMTRLVHWGLVTYNNGEILQAAKASFNSEQLSGLFDYMLNDLGAVRSGMPDLFVAYGPAEFELVEVKGPSDQLQPNQRVWLKSLSDLGIPCRVVKHRFQSIARTPSRTP